MNLVRISDLPVEPVEGAIGVSIRQLRKSHAAGFKVLTLSPGASTPQHEHAHSHDVVVLAGRALIRADSGVREANTMELVAIRPGEEHSIVNAGAEELQLLCLDCYSDP